MSLPLSEGNPVETKVKAAGVGGAFATVLIWVASQFDLEITPEVAAAIVTAVSFLAAYLAKHTYRSPAGEHVRGA